MRLSVDVGELDIDEAADGETALAAARARTRPTSSLLDWMMPGLTGLDVCRALRADPRTAGALIVIVTARVLPARPRRGARGRRRPLRGQAVLARRAAGHRPTCALTRRAERCCAAGCRWATSAASTSTEQVARACRARAGRRRRRARARAAPRRRRARALPPLGGDLARRAVPRPGAVRAARAGAAAAAARRWPPADARGRRAARTARSCTRWGSCSSAWACSSARCCSAATCSTRTSRSARGGLYVRRTSPPRARADALGAARPRRRRPARRALAARALPQRRDLPRPRRRAGALYATLVVRARARAASCCSGRSERLLDAGALGLRPVAPHAYERVAMRRRLTSRTLAASALIVVVVAGVIGRAAGGDRPPARRGRARPPLAGRDRRRQPDRAALLGVQTTIRGYPDPRQPGRCWPTTARSRADAARTALGAADAGRRRPGRSAAARSGIRDDALSYVDDYADPVIARTREAGVARRARVRAAANDGGARATQLQQRIAALRQRRAARCRRSAPATADAPRRTARC